MEVHFVHQAEDGDLAVIGIFIDDGEAQAAIQSIWDAVPGVDEAPAPLAGADPNAFLPEQRGYSRYAGSLTTPSLLRGGQLGGDDRVDFRFPGTD